jgi:hypothetical protein
MSLEITIIEFLFGIVAGTVSGLLIVKRMGQKTPTPRTTISRKLARTKSRASPKHAKPRSARTRSIHRIRRLAQPSETVSVEPTVTALAVNISSCPTCGLQAPDALMAEHFLGSPSHENGTPEPAVTTVENALFDQSQALSDEEDAKSSVRSLLQMLVPPRAFGRRHQQRTVNPLSRLVRTIEDAQSALVQPLKGPK